MGTIARFLCGISERWNFKNFHNVMDSCGVLLHAHAMNEDLSTQFIQYLVI